MKTRHIFATIAAGFALSACSDTAGDYNNNACDKAEKVAEILMDCKTWEDAFDAADDIHSITDDLEALAEARRKDRFVIEDEEADMTNEEYDKYKEEMSKRRDEARKKLTEGEKHISGNDAGKSATLRYAVSRFKKAF